MTGLRERKLYGADRASPAKDRSRSERRARIPRRPNGYFSNSRHGSAIWCATACGTSATWTTSVRCTGDDPERDARAPRAWSAACGALVAELGWAVLHRPSFVLRTERGAGAAWLTRTTRGLVGSGDAEPASTSVSPIVSGELLAEYRLAGPFTLGLHAGTGWFAHTTRYADHAPPIGDVALATGWRVQPNAGHAPQGPPLPAPPGPVAAASRSITPRAVLQRGCVDEVR